MTRRSRRNRAAAADPGGGGTPPRSSAALRLISVILRSRQAAMLGAAVEEPAQRGEQLGLVQQERIVALVGRDLDKADIGGDGVERMHQLAALARREQPVAGERNDPEAGIRAANPLSRPPR